MKIKISKIVDLHTGKEFLTIHAVCAEKYMSIDDMQMERKAILYLRNEDKLYCTVPSASKHKSGIVSIPIKVKDTLVNYQLIHPYHHKSNLDFILELEENVPRVLYDEAESLLAELSKETGRKRADLLCENTFFEKDGEQFPGKRDLALVSEKQMHVLIDKLKKKLHVPAEEEIRA